MDENRNLSEKEVIEDIRRQFNSDKHTALHDLSNNLSFHLKKNHANTVSVLYEIIQNADDCRYSSDHPKITFKLDVPQNTLYYYNNEEGFTEDDIRALCLSKSTKLKSNNQIGEKGIGFKSIFKLAEQVYLCSNGYDIYFSDTSDEKNRLARVLPYWNQEPWDKKIGQTSLRLYPLKKDICKYLEKDLRELFPEVLLFLHKIKEITIIIKTEQNEETFVHQVERSFSFITLKNGNITRKYFIYEKNQTSTNPEIIEGESRTELIIQLVFPLFLLPKLPATVFSFLPLNGYDSKFPFIINSNFILTSSREKFDTQNKWNHQIRDLIPNAFHAAFLGFSTNRNLMAQGLPKYFHFNFIPIEIVDQFFSPCKVKILNRLKSANIIPCLGGQLNPIGNINKGPELWYHFISKHHSSGHFEGVQKLVPFVDLEFFNSYQTVLKKLGYKETENVTACLQYIDDSDLISAHKNDFPWHVEFLTFLSNVKFPPAYLKGRPYLLTNELYLKRPSDAENFQILLSTPSLSKYNSLFEPYFLHYAIETKLPNEVRNWLKNDLGIKELTKTEIIPSYVTLMNPCDKPADWDSLELLINLFIELNNSGECSPVTIETIRAKFPLQLHDNSVTYLEKHQTKKTIVVPKDMTSHCWTLVFSEDMSNEFLVLHKNYLLLDQKLRAQFFELMKVTGYPPLPKANPYFPFLKSPVADKEKRKKQAEYLLLWLNANVDSLFHPTRQTVLFDIQTSEWLPTSNQSVPFLPPNQTWILDPNTKFFFDDTVNYLNLDYKDIHPKIKDELKFPSLNSINDLINQLKLFSQSSHPKFSTDFFSNFYFKLWLLVHQTSNTNKDLFEVFEKFPLIFYENQFVKSSQCVWLDVRDVNPDLCFLSSVYKDNLQSFFTLCLNIRYDLEAELYVKHWEYLIAGNRTEFLEKKLAAIYLGLERALTNENQNISAKANNLISEKIESDKLRLLTKASTWAHDGVVVPDNFYFCKLIEQNLKDVPICWFPEKTNFRQFQVLFSFFPNLTYMSASVSSKYKSSGESKQPMIFAINKMAFSLYLYKHYPDLYKEAKNSRKLEIFLNLREKVSKEVCAEYYLSNYPAFQVKRSIYLDKENRILYRKSVSPKKDVALSFKRKLAKHVTRFFTVDPSLQQPLTDQLELNLLRPLIKLQELNEKELINHPEREYLQGILHIFQQEETRFLNKNEKCTKADIIGSQEKVLNKYNSSRVTSNKISRFSTKEQLNAPLNSIELFDEDFEEESEEFDFTIEAQARHRPKIINNNNNNNNSNNNNNNNNNKSGMYANFDTLTQGDVSEDFYSKIRRRLEPSLQNKLKRANITNEDLEALFSAFTKEQSEANRFESIRTSPKRANITLEDTPPKRRRLNLNSPRRSEEENILNLNDSYEYIREEEE